MPKAFNPAATGSQDNWTTPQDFYERLNDEFGFSLDAAADLYNTKCNAFFDANQINAFESRWNSGPIWCNPPYGRLAVPTWLKLAWVNFQKFQQIIVMLLPAATETRWFHEIAVPNATEIRLVKGRLKFGNVLCKDGTVGEAAAQFPSAVVIFRPHSSLWPRLGQMPAHIRTWDWKA